MNAPENNKVRKPKLIHAFIPLIFLIILLSLNVIFFHEQTLEGANQVVLILSAAVAGLIAVWLGYSWNTVIRSIVKSIDTAMPSILILLFIGALAGTWMVSGVVPAMIYYGLKIFHPSIFLFATVIITSIVSLSTGSSWSTVATIGIALIGIGKTLGINESIVAGAVVSGSYFGDKMSPLSDTTNLAPAMTGTDLFTHIRYMTITTTPSMIITLIIFLVIGLTSKFNTVETNISDVQTALAERFNLSPLLFFVPVILIFIIICKVPPLPSILAGSLLGAVFAVIFQPHLIREISGITSTYFKAAYIGIMQSMFGNVHILSPNETVNELLKSTGMSGMLNTIWLILSAMTFGGAMESAGFLEKITGTIIRYARSVTSLIAGTIASSIFMNITASDQYIAIVVPGRMFAETYRKRGLKPEVLSRTLEDGGTLTSVLVPWNTCGATQARVLGVPTIAYAPYAFFNYINPVIAIIIAGINYKIRKYKEGEEPESIKPDEAKDNS